MATATFTTVVDRGVGDVLSESIWDDQLRDNLNQLASAHRNLLTNGGFEVWQRGNGPFTTAVYGADRWEVSSLVAGTIAITPDTATTDGSATSLKAVATGTPPSILLRNKTELIQGRGRTYQVSLRVNQSVASMLSLSLSATSGASSTVTSATTGSWVTLTQSLATATTDTFIFVYLQFPVAGTAYLDNAMLVTGTAPAPYQPLHPQEDLARCQRYYEVHGGGVGSGYFFAGYNAAASPSGQFTPFATAKAGVPTVTKNGTWAVVNCGQPAVGGAMTSGYHINAVATALGAMTFNLNSTDDSVTAEYNP